MTLEQAMSTGKRFKRPKGSNGPATWRDGSYWVLQNGKIYYFSQIKNGLRILIWDRIVRENRDATDWYILDELSETQSNPTCVCGNKHNPCGQGHSVWCDLFKKEF